MFFKKGRSGWQWSDAGPAGHGDSCWQSSVVSMVKVSRVGEGDDGEVVGTVQKSFLVKGDKATWSPVV